MADADVITAIRPTKRDPARSTIRVNNRVVATLPHTRIVDLGLAVGQPWDDQLAQVVSDAAEYDKALRAAMNRLNRRMLSSSQLRQRLRKLEHSDGVIDRVLARLTELDFINDERFGRALINETVRAKPAGPRLLQAKLMQRGVDRQLIDKLIAEHRAEADSASQTQQARDLAQRKLRTMSRLTAEVRQRRLWGALARRGFDMEVIRDALEGLPGLKDGEDADIDEAW